MICTVYFGAKDKNVVTLAHSAQRKHAFWRENKGNIKNKEITIQKENCFKIVTSKISSQINQIVVGWGYC